MKIITIGDVHGRTYWKVPLLGYDPEINTGSNTTIDDFDKVIFVGDYVDAFDVENVIMKHNLKEIIELKEKYPDKVVLLWGNHDLQYYFSQDGTHMCSGLRPEMIHDFGDMFRKNHDLFQMAFQIDNYLWTHAGIHKGWHKQRFLPFVEKFWAGDEDKLTMAEILNEMFNMNEECLYDVGRRRGGWHPVGGPFWLDKNLSIDKPLEGFHQIVGHTHMEDIKTYEKDENTSITYTDVMGKQLDKFYILEL